MKELPSPRAFTSYGATLWETLHYLEIPVDATINPAFLRDNTGLVPENIIVIIGRDPPETRSLNTRQ